MDNKTREFLESLVKAFDEIAGRITYFISFSDGVSDSQKTASDCSEKQEDETMKKYKGVNLKQRNDGRWYARIKILPGHYYDIYGRTQSECYFKLKEFLDKPKLQTKKKKDVEARIKKASEPPAYTLNDWYDYWRATYKVTECRESSIRRMDNIYNKHVRRSALGAVKLQELTGPMIQEFLSEVKSDCMRLKIYTHLSDMLKRAYLTDVIKKNPCEAINRPKYRARERLAMEPDEQKLFLDEVKDSENYPFYALMLFEGLRTGEAKALKRNDIKQNYIIVRSSMNDKNEITATKTGNIRRVPIFAAFRPIADALRSSDPAPILPKINKHTANDEFREVMKRLGMDYELYSLRHTFATNCARAGVVSKQVAIWMGHSDVSTTLRYYTNISGSFEAANVKAVDTNFDTNLSSDEDN